MNSPKEKHLKVVYRILRCLKLTLGKELFFKNLDRKIKVFTNNNWAGSRTNCKSTSGYCTFVWGNLVTWHSKKQSVVLEAMLKLNLEQWPMKFVKEYG